jgi:hypothetical protein
MQKIELSSMNVLKWKMWLNLQAIECIIKWYVVMQAKQHWGGQ